MITPVRLRVDLTTFTKILTWQSTGHTQSFRTFEIHHHQSQKFQNTHLVSIFKVIRKKWQWYIPYWIGDNRVSIMDQATHQQKWIYASFLSQIDWTKRISVQIGHKKNWINFQNWIWRRNRSASFNLVFWSLVVEILILINNNSTAVSSNRDPTRNYRIRNPIPAGNPRRESGIPRAGMNPRVGIHGSLGSPDPRQWIPDWSRVWDDIGPRNPVWKPSREIGHQCQIQAGVKQVNRNENRRLGNVWWQTDGRTDRSRRRTDI